MPEAVGPCSARPRTVWSMKLRDGHLPRRGRLGAIAAGAGEEPVPEDARGDEDDEREDAGDPRPELERRGSSHSGSRGPAPTGPADSRHRRAGSRRPREGGPGGRDRLPRRSDRRSCRRRDGRASWRRRLRSLPRLRPRRPRPPPRRAAPPGDGAAGEEPSQRLCQVGGARVAGGGVARRARAGRSPRARAGRRPDRRRARARRCGRAPSRPPRRCRPPTAAGR